MRDQIVFDNSENTTNGANSPIIRGDNNTTTVVVNHAADMNTTSVEFRRERPTWINSRTAQIVAWLASVIGCIVGIATVLAPAPIWLLDTGSVNSLLASALTNAPRAAVTAAAILTIVLAWRFALRRRRALPKIGRRLSPFRSLIPADPSGAGYRRVTVAARCQVCARNNRDEWGVIATRGHGRSKWIGFRCRLRHSTPFRADSLFTD